MDIIFFILKRQIVQQEKLKDKLINYKQNGLQLLLMHQHSRKMRTAFCNEKGHDVNMGQECKHQVNRQITEILVKERIKWEQAITDGGMKFMKEQLEIINEGRRVQVSAIVQMLMANNQCIQVDNNKEMQELMVKVFKAESRKPDYWKESYLWGLQILTIFQSTQQYWMYVFKVDGKTYMVRTKDDNLIMNVIKTLRIGPFYHPYFSYMTCPFAPCFTCESLLLKSKWNEHTCEGQVNYKDFNMDNMVRYSKEYKVI